MEAIATRLEAIASRFQGCPVHVTVMISVFIPPPRHQVVGCPNPSDLQRHEVMKNYEGTATVFAPGANPFGSHFYWALFLVSAFTPVTASPSPRAAAPVPLSLQRAGLLQICNLCTVVASRRSTCWLSAS